MKILCHLQKNFHYFSVYPTGPEHRYIWQHTASEGIYMPDTIEQRACALAVYMIETGATVRGAAQCFGISKSTVHKDLSQRLPHINKVLYQQVRKVLDVNKSQRHIRGGIATREKYKKA